MLLRPAAGYDPAPFDAGRLDRIDPGEFPDSVDRGGHQHTAVQAGTAWTEALQVVDGRQAGLWVVEGEQLPSCAQNSALFK